MSSNSVVMSRSKEEEKVVEAVVPSPLDDRDPKFWLTLAHFLFHLERYDDAILQFSRALQVYVKDAYLWNSRGHCLVALGKYEEAVSDFTKAVELDGSKPKYWYDRGLSLSYLRRYDEAVSDYTTSIELDCNVALYWSARGHVLLEMGRYSEAIAEFSSAIELDRDVGLYWSQRGHCLVKMKRYEEGLSDMERGIELFNRHRLGWMYQAEYYLERNEYDKAEKKLEDVYYPYGRNGVVIRYEPSSYETNKENNVEIPNVSQEMVIEADLFDGKMEEKDSEAEEKRLNELLEIYDEATTGDNISPQAWFQYATCLLRLEEEGDLKLVIKCYTFAIEANKKEPKYWYGRAMAHMQHGEWEKAIEDLNEAISLLPLESPYQLEYRYQQAWCCYKAGWSYRVLASCTVAIHIYHSSFKQKPSPTSVWWNFYMKCILLRGLCFSYDGLYAQALEEFNLVVFEREQCGFELTASDWSDFGWCCFQLSRYEEAIKHYTEAINLDDEVASYWYRRGECYRMIGDSERAKVDLNEAVDLNPEVFSISFLSNADSESAEMKRTALLEKVGVIHQWEHDIILFESSNLAEAYFLIGCRQESYSRMKLWLNLSVEEEHAKNVEERERSPGICDHVTFDMRAKKMLGVLSFVPSGFEVKSWEYEALRKEKDIGEACLKIASKQSCFERAISWLHIGTSSQFSEGLVCEFLKVCFILAMKRHLTYKVREAGLNMMRLLPLLEEKKDCDLEFRYPDNKISLNPEMFTRAALLMKKARHLTVDPIVVPSFLVQTLLCGSLRRNETSSLNRSFFSSGLREVQLLPIIAGYLVEKTKKKEEEKEGSQGDKLISGGYRGRLIENLIEIGLSTIEDGNGQVFHDQLLVKHIELVAFLPLLSPFLSATTSLCLGEYERFSRYTWREFTLVLDLSILSQMDVSKLVNLRVKACVVHSLSPLSQCNFSVLESLSLDLTPLQPSFKTLDGLTKNNTTSLKKLSISYARDLVDLSSLKDCDLSSLEELTFTGCPFLSDISCLENCSFPSLKTFDIDLTQISDLSVLSTWKGFSPINLVLDPCSIKDLSSLSQCDLSKLQSLSLTFSERTLHHQDNLYTAHVISMKKRLFDIPRLVDISSLKDCDLSSLEELSFNGCSSLSDISCLENCSFPSLKKVVLKRTQISDLSVLSTWKDFSPTHLNFAFCPIKDLSPLSHISFSSPSRVSIDVQSTLVSDLSPLEGISNSGGGEIKVFLRSTPVEKILQKGSERPPKTVGAVVIGYYGGL